MERYSYKTQSASKKIRPREWFTIDGKNQIVGRLASQVANLLRGKNKTDYTPHQDSGDHIIITNASKVIFTGKKEKNKSYITHTKYPGGQKITTPTRMRKANPTKILHLAVKRMLPKNRLSRKIIKKLHLFPDATHNHHAQKPKTQTIAQGDL